jgi:hypothetical protein
MNVRLEAGQFGWDYLLVFSDGKEYLVQTDHDYPEAATMFGFADSPDEYATTSGYYSAASDWLDQRIGETHPVHPEAPLYLRAAHTDEPPPESEEDRFVPLTPTEVVFSLEVIREDQDLPSDEEWVTPELRRSIRQRLDSGDDWAWGIVGVFARSGNLIGKSYLHGCSYQNKEDFIRNSGYYEDMKSEALADLNQKTEAEFNRRIQRRQRESLTAPLTIEFTDPSSPSRYFGMSVKHDGSLDRDEIERLLSRPTYNALGELFENAISNGILEWIDPAEINAQTDMPMLAKSEDVQRDPETNALLRCESVYVWLNYQVSSLVEAIFRPSGAFLIQQITNLAPAGRTTRRGRTGSGAPTRMEEVVKEQRFPLEGEWEKDER